MHLMWPKKALEGESTVAGNIMTYLALLHYVYNSKIRINEQATVSFKNLYLCARKTDRTIKQDERTWKYCVEGKRAVQHSVT